MRLLSIALLFLTASACRSTPEARRVPADSLVPRPWTRAFESEAILVADEIFIEGPEDLLTHVAVVQDPEWVEYETKAVTEGLRQELRLRQGAVGDVRAQLDGWSLAATRRMVILQRPGEVPILVRARGNALWARGDGTGEQRQDELVFRGRRGE